MARRHNNKGRSTGEARHVRLYHFLLKSPAWQTLTAVERCVYVEIARRYNGSNNGFIAFSCRQGADELHVSKSTVSRAVSRLVELGFVQVMVPGGFNRKTLHATEYRLTEYPCDRTSEMPSKAFMKWELKAA